MEKSARRLLMKKSNDTFSLGLFNHIFQCSKCKKYNTINYSNTTLGKPAFQNCTFCCNPNFIKK